MTTLYHGTSGTATLHRGLCLTDDPHSAAIYAADKNDGGLVTEIALDLNGLDVIDVEYDYDGCEPIIPDGCSADVVCFADCDMQGRDHDTWLLLTDRAVSAATITDTLTTEEG